MSSGDSGQAKYGVMPDADNPAVALVRQKLHDIYATEPSAVEEQKEITSYGAHSKHQKYMQKLMSSGKSYADIQLAWHNYYQTLSDTEKHEVWQEFYENHTKTTQKPATIAKDKDTPKTKIEQVEKAPESIADLKKKVLNSVSANGKLQTKHHVKSIAFSLAFASLVTGVLFFVGNNERFIAPFVTPSKSVAASALITDGSNVGAETKVIIPKINLETPVVTEYFDASSEKATWDILEKGVVMYPDTGVPGEKDRNPIIFGHSSGNLFNRGLAKFIFVRLHELQIGDTYAINYGSKQYVYKIFARYVVDPTAVEYLYKQPSEYGKTAMSTLITCDPPGTALKRLILQGEQISPDPNTNTSAKPIDSSGQKKAAEVPSNSPSLLDRIFGL